MTIITQTIYSRALAMQRKIGRPYEVMPYTTVNEALNDPLAVPQQPSIPTAGSEVFEAYNPENDTGSMVMRYMVIGNNGHRTIYGENMHAGMPSPMEWAANNSGNYWNLPFLMVPVDQALAPSQRNKYRLRKILQVGSELFEAYFAMVLDFPTSQPEYRIYRKENNQIVDSAIFQPTRDNMIPTHPEGDLTNDKTHVSVTQPYNAVFTTEMINNIVSACALLYGTPDVAVISEIGICHAVEKSVTARYPYSGTQTPGGLSPGLFFEAAAMQIDTHVSLVQPVSYNHTGFSVSLHVGGGVPLYPTSATQN